MHTYNYLIFHSLSNGEDFITTEQLQKRMKDVASNSSNDASCSRSNNILHNNPQKNDISTNNFSKNGLPEDSTAKKGRKIPNI